MIFCNTDTDLEPTVS